MVRIINLEHWRGYFKDNQSFETFVRVLKVSLNDGEITTFKSGGDKIATLMSSQAFISDILGKLEIIDEALDSTKNDSDKSGKKNETENDQFRNDSHTDNRPRPDTDPYYDSSW